MGFSFDRVSAAHNQILRVYLDAGLHNLDELGAFSDGGEGEVLYSLVFVKFIFKYVHFEKIKKMKKYFQCTVQTVYTWPLSVQAL